MAYFRPHRYIKDESSDPIYKTVNRKFVFRQAAYPTLFVSLGVFVLLTQVVVPLVVFKTQEEISRPVQASVLGVATGFQAFEFSELQTGQGITTPLSTSRPEFYYLTVPKLEIERAKVEVQPADLNPENALGHYIGSALPGESGNTFIYGHSVLPAFYNPKNYKTIFSTLHNLEPGDTFSIEYRNKTLNYVVEQKRDIKPEEVDPLANVKPEYLNESTITLMTCSPPGTKLRRLLVNATLVD